MSYNSNIYQYDILGWIPDIGKDDLAFLCNKAGSQYQSINDGCVDNFRASRDCGGWSIQYDTAIGKGCCGFSDQIHINPKTGNAFWIGFNFGH